MFFERVTKERRNMRTLWIVVADNASAKMHATESRGGAPTLVAELAHPEGRLLSQELVSDRPGRTSRDSSAQPQAFAERDSPAELERARFARRIAAFLDEAHESSRFAELALVMPPKLLGLVREHLKKPTRATVVATIDKRLTSRPVDDVVREVVAVRQPVPLA